MRRLPVVVICSVVLLGTACGSPNEPTAAKAANTTSTTPPTTTSTQPSSTTRSTTQPTTPPLVTSTSTYIAPPQMPNLIESTRSLDDRSLTKTLLVAFSGQDADYINGHLSFVRKDQTIDGCKSWGIPKLEGSNPNQPAIIWCDSAMRFYLMDGTMATVRQRSETHAAAYILMAAAHQAIGDEDTQPVENYMATVAEIAGHVAKAHICNGGLTLAQANEMSSVFGVETPRFAEIVNRPCT